MKKILLIEDDKDTLDVLNYLVEDLGYDVFRSSETLSLNEIVAISPDIILLDHWMPYKFGGDLCKEIKSFIKTKDIPVVMLSANNNIEQIAKDSCADGFLSKPFDLDALVALIKKFDVQSTPS